LHGADSTVPASEARSEPQANGLRVAGLSPAGPRYLRLETALAW